MPYSPRSPQPGPEPGMFLAHVLGLWLQSLGSEPLPKLDTILK